jgi:hypothetical protein
MQQQQQQQLASKSSWINAIFSTCALPTFKVSKGCSNYDDLEIISKRCL